MTAASYARKLLTRMIPSKVESEQKLNEIIAIKEGIEHGELWDSSCGVPNHSQSRNELNMS